MKLFVKILLFVFIALVTNVSVTSATITFSNFQEAATSFSYYTEIPKTVVGVVENDFANCCQNEQKLVDYRSRSKGIEAVATKGVTAPKGWITQPRKITSVCLRCSGEYFSHL